MNEIEVMGNGNIKVRVPLMLRVLGNRKRAVVRTEFGDEALAPLTVHVARAFRWRKLIDEGTFGSSKALAAALKLDRRYVDRTLQLAMLAPEIIHAILENTAPESMNLNALRGFLPVLWNEQLKLFKMD